MLTHRTHGMPSQIAHGNISCNSATQLSQSLGFSIFDQRIPYCYVEEDANQRCPFCDQILAEEDWKLHIIDHNFDSYYCPKCCKHINGPNVVVQHAISHFYSEITRKCTICNQSKNVLQDMLTHISQDHGIPYFTCPYCKYPSNNSSQAKRHLLQHNFNIPPNKSTSLGQAKLPVVNNERHAVGSHIGSSSEIQEVDQEIQVIHEVSQKTREISQEVQLIHEVTPKPQETFPEIQVIHESSSKILELPNEIQDLPHEIQVIHDGSQKSQTLSEDIHEMLEKLQILSWKIQGVQKDHINSKELPLETHMVLQKIQEMSWDIQQIQKGHLISQELPKEFHEVLQRIRKMSLEIRVILKGSPKSPELPQDINKVLQQLQKLSKKIKGEVPQEIQEVLQEFIQAVPQEFIQAVPQEFIQDISQEIIQEVPQNAMVCLPASETSFQRSYDSSSTNDGHHQEEMALQSIGDSFNEGLMTRLRNTKLLPIITLDDDESRMEKIGSGKNIVMATKENEDGKDEGMFATTNEGGKDKGMTAMENEGGKDAGLTATEETVGDKEVCTMKNSGGGNEKEIVATNDTAFASKKKLHRYIPCDRIFGEYIFEDFSSVLPCLICGHLCKHKSVREHMMKHNFEELFCVKCQTFFKRKVWLVNHLLSHYEMRPYGCTLCKSKFTVKKDIIRHIRTVHHILYACPDCKTFVTDTNPSLTEHMNFHCEMRTTGESDMCINRSDTYDHLQVIGNSSDMSDKDDNNQNALVAEKGMSEQHPPERDSHYREDISTQGNLSEERTPHTFLCIKCNQMFLSQCELEQHKTLHDNEIVIVRDGNFEYTNDCQDGQELDRSLDDESDPLKCVNQFDPLVCVEDGNLEFTKDNQDVRYENNLTTDSFNRNSDDDTSNKRLCDEQSKLMCHGTLPYGEPSEIMSRGTHPCDDLSELMCHDTLSQDEQNELMSRGTLLRDDQSELTSHDALSQNEQKELMCHDTLPVGLQSEDFLRDIADDKDTIYLSQSKTYVPLKLVDSKWVLNGNDEEYFLALQLEEYFVGQWMREQVAF